MPPLTVRPCGFPQSVVAPGEIKPPAAAPGAAARICPATTPKRRQWRKQQGVVGAALQYLQGRKSRRKYWLSARDPPPQVGPPRCPRVRFLLFKPFGSPFADNNSDRRQWRKQGAVVGAARACRSAHSYAADEKLPRRGPNGLRKVTPRMKNPGAEAPGFGMVWLN